MGSRRSFRHPVLPRYVVVPVERRSQSREREAGSIIVFTIVTIVTIVVNAASAFASFARAKFITDTFTEVDIPPRWLPLLASLQTAGAIGLLLGLLGVPIIGLASAIGLTLYYIGAVVVHLRAGAYKSLASPALFLGLAIATLVLTAIR